MFPSTRKTFLVNIDLHRLQRATLDDLDDCLIRRYREMYDVFFEERALIPSGHFHEVAFEELEEDPLGQVKRIYEALNLPDFSQVESALKSYVASIAGYQKNTFPNLAEELRQRISHEWRPAIEEWGYRR